jgi:energy-coupling factor transport system ATP-binding protein
MELFFEIYRQGITIILVTHDMNHVLNYATHVIVMRDGKVERKTTPRELFADLKGEDVISLPPLYKFMHDLVDRGCPLKIDKINNEKDLARAIKGLKSNA